MKLQNHLDCPAPSTSRIRIWGILVSTLQGKINNGSKNGIKRLWKWCWQCRPRQKLRPVDCLLSWVEGDQIHLQSSDWKGVYTQLQSPEHHRFLQFDPWWEDKGSYLCSTRQVLIRCSRALGLCGWTSFIFHEGVDEAPFWTGKCCLQDESFQGLHETVQDLWGLVL